MPDTFISYSRRNKEFVQKLVERLSADGKRDIWIDWEDIPVTADWLEEIYKGIRESDNFVFIITPDSVQSEVCGWELKYALDNKKRLIPVLHQEIVEDEDKKAMHPAVSSHNWIFFRDEDDFDSQFKLLVEALDTDLDHVREHTRLLVRAKQWEERDKGRGFLISGEELIEAEQWLSKAADKDPEPIELQMQFIYESRKSANRRQQTIAAASLFAAAISTVLAILAIFFFFNAEEQRQIADEQRVIAEDNEAEAVEQREIAERNAEEANSLALAASAQLAQSVNDDDLAIALGLAANGIENPPVQSQRILEDAAFTPGTRYLFNAHEGGAFSVAISPDGTLAASGGVDTNIVLWNLETGEEIMTLDAHEGRVSTLSFSPDGETVLSGADDSVLILWDLEGNEIQRLTGHEGGILDATFNADGTQVLSGSRDGTLNLWDVESGEVIQQFTGHAGEVISVDFSPDGTRAVSGSGDETIIVWDAESGESLLSITVGGLVTSVRFNEDGTRILGGSGTFNVEIWDTETGDVVSRVGEHLDFVWSAQYDPSGLFVVSASSDNTVRLWDVRRGEQVLQFGGHTANVRDVAVSQDGHHALSASEDGTVRYWDLAHGSQQARLDGHSFDVVVVEYSEDGESALTGSWDASIIVWDLTTGEPQFSLTGHTGVVSDATYTPDGTRIVASDSDGILLWDLENREQLARYPHQFASEVSVFPDGNSAVSGNFFGTVELWDLQEFLDIETTSAEVEEGEDPVTNAPLHIFEGHSAAITNIALSSDGSLMVTADSAGIMIVWNVENRAEITRFEFGAQIDQIALSPDDSTLLVAIGANMQLIDLASEEIVRRFIGHGATVFSVDFDSTGNLILSSSSDETIRLWDVATGAELQRITTNSTVRAIDFSPDSTSAITGADDFSIRIWDVTPPQLADIIDWAQTNRYVRNFTCDERIIYPLDSVPECAEIDETAATDEAESTPEPES